MCRYTAIEQRRSEVKRMTSKETYGAPLSRIATLWIWFTASGLIVGDVVA